MTAVATRKRLGSMVAVLALAAATLAVIVGIAVPAVRAAPPHAFDHDVGLVDPATGMWHLRKASTGAITSFLYGTPGDIPFVGDWDCDGDETPGLYRQSDGFVYLRNSNDKGPAHIEFFFGSPQPSDVPLAGDFNGDGCDTVSIYRPGEQRIYIANTLGHNNGAISADFSYVFGNPGDKPFVGDFNGNGSETIGLHRESSGFVYYRNTHTTGVADNQYFFGNPADRLVAGDWGVVDGVYTPAVFRPSTSTFFFRHTNTQGVADSEFVWPQPGAGNWRPVSGVMGLSVWAQAMGGTGSDQGLGVAVDGSGNVYTTGYFSGTADFDPGPGVFNLTSSGSDDVFVSKLDSSGSLVWAQAMGGTGSDQGLGVAVDGSGNVHTTGYFSGTADFDPGPGVFNLTSSGSDDVFVSKLDSSGSLVWAQAMGGTGSDQGLGVAVDGSGNVHTTGYFSGTADFDPGPGVFNLTSSGSDDVFVSKLDSSGSLVWAQAMGGTGSDQGLGVAVDGSGNVHTTGYFSGTADFDPGPGVFNLTSSGSDDVFVSKLDSSGSLVWAQAMGGTGSDQGLGVAVDGSGNVYTTGYFSGTADFDPGPGVFNLTSSGSDDVFVSKLDSSGSLVWAQAMGGTGSDQGLGVAVDGSGNVYTTGYFSGTADFDPGPGVFNLTSSGSDDVFVSKLDSSGSLVWAQAMGGTGSDQGLGVAVDGSGNVYTTGYFSGTADFDPGPGVFNLTSSGSDDVFVSKLGDVTPPTVALTTPAEGATMTQNSVVLADFGCVDDPGGSGIASCVGDVANGAGIDTATPALHTFTVVGTDNAGNVTVVTHTYTVKAVPPTSPPPPAFMTHDVGLVDPATGIWHLRDAGSGTVSSFYYGIPGDIPFMGDWDCNGTETPGLYRQSDGFAYIRNSNTQGVADVTFFMGNPSDIPLAGDFNGDGCDTVSIYRPAEQRIYIANSLGPNNGAISADFSYIFGNPGDKPFVGDFNGNGTETIGLHRESTGFVYFRNTHTIGFADVDYFFGDPGDRLVAGDWGVVDGVFTPAVFRPSNQTLFFRHTNTQGNADSQFVWPQPNASTWRPVSGVMGL